MEWTEFESGDEPEVLTADLCAAFTCEKCPGFAKAGDVQPDHPDPETTVFCMHWCHQVAPEVWAPSAGDCGMTSLRETFTPNEAALKEAFHQQVWFSHPNGGHEME
jgi:hypothetical protein